MIYTAPCVMLLLRPASITRASGRGLGPGNREFLGPVKWHRADRRVPFGAQKTRGYYYLPRQLLLDGEGSAAVFINSCLMTQARLTLSLSVQSRADGYFTFREIDRRHVAVILSKSVQDLTDQSKPTSDIRWVFGTPVKIHSFITSGYKTYSYKTSSTLELNY
jgi:hypothetical protein